MKKKKESDLFPEWATNFPFRLEYKDGSDIRICWFSCETDLNKHLERNHLTSSKCKIDVKDGAYTPPTKKKTRPKKQQKLFSTLEDFFK